MNFEQVLSRQTRLFVALVILVWAGAAHADLVATKATTNSVTLTWAAPGDGSGGIVSLYDLRYSTAVITDANWATAVKVSTEPTPLAPGSMQTYTISGLTSNTRYYFAAKAADNVPNWSSMSSVVMRTTPADGIAPAATSNLAASASTQTSVTLTWNAPGDDVNTGTATAYDIRYSTSPITGANFSLATKVSGVAAPKIAGSAENLTINNLTPQTTYYFALRTVDEWYNWSPVSNVVIRATSLDTTPPAAVTDLRAN